MHQLIRITAPYYVAGIEVNGSGYIVNWAPILRWTAGKSVYYVLNYFRRKGYQVEYL